MAKTPTWQRKAGQNPNGGLNEAGRRSLKAAGHDIKRPQPEGGSRRDSFCARMKGMKAKLTSSETANDPDSRINKSLRAWNCADGGQVWDKERPKHLGEPEPLSAKEKKSAKAHAKAAGRPYPNLVDNMRAARAGGGGIKAAVNLAKDIIKSYHGSPKQFERFDTGKIGTGVGAQAYGHGLYFSDNPSVARGYRHSTEPVTISGRPVYSLYQDIENKAANVPIQNASSYYDKLSVLEHLMDKGDALAVRDAAEREMFTPAAYEWFRKAVEPNLRTPGGLYEVGIHADPKKFIGLYDELALGDPLRERVASLAERAMRLDEGNPLFRKGQEAMKAVRRQNATGAQMTDALDELLGYQKNPLREFTGISPELKAPEAVSKYLENEGYAGYTYPHGTDAPGPEMLNRVVFDPKIIDIMHRYGQGGQVRPEMGAGGSGVKAAVQLAQDIIKAYHGSPHKFDKFDLGKVGTGEGAQAFGHGMYFADSENVARSYRDALAHKADPRNAINDLVYQFTQGRVAAPTSENIQRFMSQDQFMKPYAENPNIMARIREIIQGQEPGGSVSDQAMHSYRELEHLLPEPSKGHMYEVGIRANPEHMLDWDKPMVQQSPIVRDALKQAYSKRGMTDTSAFLNSEINPGMDAYQSLVRTFGGKNVGSPMASRALQEAGVPGIRYLDQGSRGSGEGTSNYVVFNPEIVDLLRRYASGGSVDRLHFDDGGLARIEDLIRQAKGEEAATQASHPVGMSSEVEFAPIEIDEPMTGKKIPLGSLPAPTAAVVNPAANVLAQFGPYAMGPVPAGIAAARDIISGVREGSGMDIATAALGAPGKAAKYGLPALGALTDVLSPTEAQAGTGSKLMKGLSGIALRRPELFKAEHPYFPEGFREKIAGVVSPFSSDEDIAKAALEMAQKYRTPLENKSNLAGAYYGTVQSTDPRSVLRTVEDIPGISLRPKTAEQSYEDLYKIGKGGTLINLAGDRSDFGRLTHIGGKELDFPVDLHAGPKYMREPNPGEIWANDPKHAGKLQKAVSESEKKGPVIGLYTPMGAQSVSSSQHMFEALMAQIKNSGASKEDLEAFDKVIKSGAHFGSDKANAANAIEYMKGNFGKNKQIEPWPGLSNPKAAAEWAKNLPGHHRAAIVNEMEKARWKDKGFPEVGVTRVAVTDPELLGTSQNLIGGRASTLTTKNPRGAEPLFQHSTYGSPTYGEYLMELPFVQRQYAMPEAIKKYTEPTKTGTVVHPFSEQNLGRGSFRKLFETNFLTQPINQEWLDTLMTGLERQKQYGFNRGGKAS